MNTEGLLNVIVGVEGADKVIGLFKDIGNAAVDTAVKADRMSQMMEAASGTMGVAAKNMEFVKQISKQMGTELYASADAFAKLTASTRGTTLEGEQTKKMFEALTAANSKLGGSTADLSGMILSFSQMISKGVVSMEELRGQLGERLPGAMKMAADSMGITTQALIDQVSKGQVLAEDLLPKLADAINKTYNDGKFDSAASNINRVTNEWENFKVSVTNTEFVNSSLKSVADRIKDMTMFAEYLKATFLEFNTAQRVHTLQEIASRSEYGVEKDPRIEAFKELRKQQSEYTKAQKEVAALENQPRRMGDTDRIEKLNEAKKKLSEITNSYVIASDAVRKFDVEARDVNKKIDERANIKPQYITETSDFVAKKEIDKIKKFQNEREEQLKAEQRNWQNYIKQYENNATMQLEITAAYKQRELAINKEYDSKIAEEQKRRDAPGIRAQKKEDRDAAKVQREYEAMVERSRDLIASLENDYLNYTGKTFSDSIKKIDALADAQKKTEIEKVRNAHSTGEQLIAANEYLAKVNAAIDAKAAADKQKIAKEAVDKIKDYENDLTMDIAKLNNDRLTQAKLVYDAQTKANKKELDKQVQDAKDSEQKITNAQRLYEQRQTLLDKKYSEEKVRISGSYLEKISLKMRETYSSESSFVDEFSTSMVDTTMNAASGIADAFAQMAVSGKASWADLANSIILEIEKMIAKMMVMYAVQQLVGMAGSFFGGETGGLMSKSVGMDPFNGSGMFSSFANANRKCF